jgi:diaminopimelate decarboxylase
MTDSFYNNEAKIAENNDATSIKVDAKKRRKTRPKVPVHQEKLGNTLASVFTPVEDDTDESTLARAYSFVAEELNHAGLDCPFYPEAKPVTSTIDRIIAKTKSENGFVHVDLGKVVSQAIRWKRALPRVQPFYAVKSNPDINIVRTLFALGVNFDCASKGEIELVMDVGADATQIIYANPSKGPDHLRFAREKDVRLMTFDNTFELEKILKHFPDAEVVLRISSNDSMSLMPFGYKFGASYEDALAVILACKQLNAKLVGISFHVGSGCYSPIGFVDTLKTAKKLFIEAEKAGFKLSLLDIGGGFPGDNAEGKIKFEEIADAIRPVIDLLFPVNQVTVIAEPGRYFCTSSTTIAMPVVSKREYVARRRTEEAGEIISVKETQYYVTDGVYGNFNNIIYDHAVPVCKPLREPPLNAVMNNSTFFGPTCDSIDVVAKCIPFCDLEIGDWVFFPNMGAYTVAAGSTFNGFARLPIHYEVFDHSN